MGLLQQRGLEQRCLRLAAGEASEAELGLVHSPEYVALMRGTQALGTEELRALSGQYDAVYLHPSTFHSAQLAAGAGLQLVDAVLTGAVHNGLALVRPPGHHSQRAAANGFCVFNNVAIAARHAQQKHGLHRILIVDWDIHHGQGTQYTFEDDPRWGWEMLTTWLPSCTCCSPWLLSALESIQSVRAAQVPHWTSLQQQDLAPVLNPSNRSPEGRPSPLLSQGPEFKAAAAQATVALSSLLDRLHLRPMPPVRTVALASLDTALVLPHEVPHQEGSALKEEAQSWASLHEALAEDEAASALGKVLNLLDRILDGQVSSGIAATPASAAVATLDVAIRCGLSQGAQRLLCVAVGQLDRPSDLADDGRNLWLNIRGKEAGVLSMFHVSMPLPGTTGGFLNFLLALVLPLAYSFRPDLVLLALGPDHGLRDPQAALLASLLRAPAGCRVLALVDEESTTRLAGVLAQVLHGEAPPSLGPFCVASPEDTQALMHLRGQLEPQWKMLQVAAPA
uniref:Histone deacetylase 10 n=1 Tax=Myotis myotis TaxID=51298 RepID=A0A7J7QUH0_MYOMY|nr:histone deacetylase 10 [Myotis myotis]